MRWFLSVDLRQQIPPRVAQRNEIAAGKLTNGAGMGIEDLFGRRARPVNAACGVQFVHRLL
jgi:hypothetical protein